MKLHKLLFFSIMIILSLLLTSCRLVFDEQGLEDAVVAVFEDGDFSEYNSFVCEEDQVFTFLEESDVDASVTCRVPYGSVECVVEIGGDIITLDAYLDGEFKACNVVLGFEGETIRLVDLVKIANGETVFPNETVLTDPAIEDAFETAFEDGRVEELNAFLCRADQISQEDAEALSAQGLDFIVSCEVDEDSFKCLFGVVGELDLAIMRGDIEDGRLCNITIDE